jgi:hypothetical protein
LGFNVINVEQMTATRREPNGETYAETLPLFPVSLKRNVKSQEIFKLNCLNHVIIKVELYRDVTSLTQCYNCQNFDHVWANCGGGHVHRECPEKTNTESTPSGCNCSLEEGDKPHPVSHRGCSHAKGEEHKDMLRREMCTKI